MQASLRSRGPEHPILGAPRDASCQQTLSIITQKLMALSPLRGERFLDVGCGDGSFTIPLSQNYAEVCGIDLQESWLDRFRERVAGDPRFLVCKMSASQMTFPDEHFDTLVTIETIEHIPDLMRAADEFHRVLKPGGECLVTCPNRLFPFENHGIRVGSRVYATRIPLITYLPPLHDRYSLARVFTVRTLDQLFGSRGFRRTRLAYAWPTFEHGGNPFQRFLKPLFGIMRAMEASPLKMFGTSIIAKFEKVS